MYAQNDNAVPSSRSSAARLIMTTSRATLRTRPGIQRVLIRSWEYIQPVRVTILVIRLLVVLWLAVLSAVLLSAGNAWGWALPPAAVAVLVLSAWMFATAARGWPVAEA
jgi:hypothetical protein